VGRSLKPEPEGRILSRVDDAMRVCVELSVGCDRMIPLTRGAALRRGHGVPRLRNSGSRIKPNRGAVKPSKHNSIWAATVQHDLAKRLRPRIRLQLRLLTLRRPRVSVSAPDGPLQSTATPETCAATAYLLVHLAFDQIGDGGSASGAIGLTLNWANDGVGLIWLRPPACLNCCTAPKSKAFKNQNSRPC